MNYSDAELRDAAAAKIQRMVLLALGKNYLRREKVCFFFLFFSGEDLGICPSGLLKRPEICRC